MRGYCEFRNCQCDEYHGLDNKCLLCQHGKCWHKNIKNIKNNFISKRKSAHKPTYVFSFNGYRYLQPIIKYPLEKFCKSIYDLPA